MPESRAILTVTTDKERTVTLSIEVTHIPIDQAAGIVGLAPELLRQFVRYGILPGEAPYRTAGIVGSVDLDAAAQLAAQLHDARDRVAGNPITAPDAAVKYGIETRNLYRWHQEGWIKVLSGTRRNRLFDEGDIAMARSIADLVGMKSGKKVFPQKESN